MLSNSNQRGISNAYTFWIATLMFGLPLLSSFCEVQSLNNYVFVFMIPYICAVAVIGLAIMRWSSAGKPNLYSVQAVSSAPRRSSYRLWYVALSLATVAVVCFGLMKDFIATSYPQPSSSASIVGMTYFVAVSVAAGLGFPLTLVRLFPILKNSLDLRGSLKLAIIVGVVYFFTYLLLVNQIVITGFNTTPGNFVSSPTGVYPYAYVFTAGPPPSAFLESLVYVPQVLIQLNDYVNLTFYPFEMVLAVLLSTLVAASVLVTRYMISNRGHSCLTGATVSGIGGFLGFTATCPSCLAPTLISVFFGGFSSLAVVQSIYSSIFGVLLPPLVSLVALLVSLLVLENRSKNLIRLDHAHAYNS